MLKNCLALFQCSLGKERFPDLLLVISVASSRTFPFVGVESVVELTLVAGTSLVAAERASPASNIFFDAVEELLRKKADFGAVPAGLLTSGG